MINLQDYEKKSLIEKGTYGEVYEVIEKRSNNKCAAKIYFSEIKDKSSDTVDSIKNELKIISGADYPSIIKFIGYNLKNFEEEKKPTIIMELAANGSLKKLLDSPQKPQEWQITKKIINIYGIASGMAYLHSKSIIHRDLKPGNILLDEYFFPKISDFNISKISADIANIELSNVRGTPLYMSPEAHNSEYSYANDVYAFSIIVYQILTGETPFQNINKKELPKKISREGFKPVFDDNFPKSYKDLILKCGSLNPTDRPKFSDIVQQMEDNDDFILEGVDVEQYKKYIEIIKKYNPDSNTLSITAQFDEFFKQGSTSTQKATLRSIKTYLYPYELMIQLSEECQQLIKDSEDNPEFRYLVGKYSIENQKGFPMNTEIGIQYLKKSMKEGCIRANLYYSQILIRGKIIRKNQKKAKKYIEKILGEKNAEAYLLYGIILEQEKKYDDAKIYFLKAIDGGNVRAMYLYAKMLYYGEGCDVDKNEAYEFFKMAKRNYYKKADKFIKQIKLLKQKENDANTSKSTQNLGSKYNINESNSDSDSSDNDNFQEREISNDDVKVNTIENNNNNSNDNDTNSNNDNDNDTNNSNYNDNDTNNSNYNSNDTNNSNYNDNDTNNSNDINYNSESNYDDDDINKSKSSSINNIDAKEKKLHQLKIIMLGATGVGKSSLLDVICNRDFKTQRIPTSGISIERVRLSRDSKSNVELLIWDTFGQERFLYAIPPNTYRNADAAFVCYAKYFESDAVKWINRVKEYSPDCKIFLIETKSDQLDEEQRSQSQKTGQILINENNCYIYVLTSAKTKDGVQNLLNFAGNLSAENSLTKLPESVDLNSPQNNAINSGNNGRCNC